ncbi:triacylglycerol lipase [Dorcoceras hygrometricum]|uniref:Triacylglycerol lipase n=1 Tax=Dorcoceras hygrometricum TaxID=472368 RepID=A0A2Z7BTA0_9LAMI|nr:triacylglycerol lipase [Dorcoceras hygrometricum]
MGCPGQARTKPRSKIQSSQRSAGNHVGGHAAAAIKMPAPSTAGRATKLRDGRASPRDAWRTAVHSSSTTALPLERGRETSAAHHARPSRGCARYRAREFAPPHAAAAKADGFYHERNHLFARIRTSPMVRRSDDGGRRRDAAVGEVSTCVTLSGSGIQLAVGPQPLRLRNNNFGLAQRIMVKRLATSRHDPLDITDSACKTQLVVVSVQYGPFNSYIPIRSTTVGKSRVARDPIAMHTSWRSNSDIASVTRVSMTFRVVRTNQYNQDLGLIHSTKCNHLESPNEGSSIDHQVTIYLHAQNITMFPTNETWYFAPQILVSSSRGLILILMVQSTRN